MQRSSCWQKKVDAVYSDDPETNPDAVRYESLTHKEVLEKELKVMDSTAASLCRDNNISIHVFAIAEEGNVDKGGMRRKNWNNYQMGSGGKNE